MNRHDEMKKAFLKYCVRKPEVGLLFHKFTMERINRGFANYSAKAICERIRWETNVPSYAENEFKIGNNFPAFFARRWMDRNPQYNGFFRTRHQISKEAPALNSPELGPLDFPDEPHVSFNIEDYL